MLNYIWVLNLREISGKTGSKCFVGENVYCLLYLSFSSLSLFAGLLSLDLSYNLLIDLDLASFENLGQLRHLKLSHNKLANLPSHCWRFIPYLASLDISFNPIRVLTKESFYGLQRLQELMVHDLPDLKRFDADSLTQLTYLSHLYIQSWPEIEKFKFRLGSVISGLASLKSLKAKILEPSHILTDQLLGSFGPKLRKSRLPVHWNPWLWRHLREWKITTSCCLPSGIPISIRCLRDFIECFKTLFTSVLTFVTINSSQLLQQYFMAIKLSGSTPEQKPYKVSSFIKIKGICLYILHLQI